MGCLNGRIITFARASGVSLDGHIMFSTVDVQHNWLDVSKSHSNFKQSFEFLQRVLSNPCMILQFLKNIPAQDEYLKHIPSYENALSQVLRKIQISRRKFMPKAQVVHYAAYLRKVTTSMLDYLTQNSQYPKSWPTDLSNFDIVIES